jgi:glycosyltransferase involved in cell wall biosynthesis
VRIWLVTIGEPLPIGVGIQDRLHRTGYFARFLANEGHEVTWWTSTFDHSRKKEWYRMDTITDLQKNLRVILMHGRGYKRNVSLARIMDHRDVAKRFRSLATREATLPDIIVSAFPTIELSSVSVEFGISRSVPVVVDVRDLWPEVFYDSLPVPLHPIAKRVSYPFYASAKKTFQNATAISGATDEFIDWALALGNRERSRLDRSLPFGYTSEASSQAAIEKAEAFWKDRGLSDSAEGSIICFFGYIGRQFDFEPVIQSARDLRMQGRKVRFVICGSGDFLEHFRKLASHEDNILFPGWVGAAEIKVLMSFSLLGLAPYRQTRNFEMNFPNKPVEYLSGGLPIATGLSKGLLCRFVEQENCGFSYHGRSALLTKGIIDLLDNPGKRDELRGISRQVFEKMFDANTVCKQMLQHLEEVAQHAATTRQKEH